MLRLLSGLKKAVGEQKAEELLKGCKVHWQRSCQRIANRVASCIQKQAEGKRYFF